MKILKLIKLARPKEWIKNFFVFAPLLFSGLLFNTSYLTKSLEAFIAFCFVASCVYIINDIIDVEADRAHKKKRFRPIASGDVTVRQAQIFFILLIILAAGILTLLPWKFAMIIGLYLLNNVLYSTRLKHMVLLDVFSISIGFMLRVIAGAYAIDVQVSSWMIITTIFISLFLAISKRRAEVSGSDATNMASQRKVLSDYSLGYVDQINTITAAGTILSYALYTGADKTITVFHTDKLIYTTPFVIFGIFRYLYLLHNKNLGENPAGIVTKDVPILVVCILWALVCAAIIYQSKFGLY
ncbi:decaprenyl-phosphate phosphoribosyltransferase [soil metagenome]